MDSPNYLLNDSYSIYAHIYFKFMITMDRQRVEYVQPIFTR